MTDNKRNLRRTAILSGLITAGGLLSPVAFAIIMTQITNQHGLTNFGQEYGIFVIIGLGLIVGGFWGEGMARLTKITRRWRMRIAGALTLVPAIFADVLLLTLFIEETKPGRQLGAMPQHQLYLIAFTFSTFFVSTVVALVLNLMVTRIGKALRNAGLVGLISTVAFLIVAIVMDALGYRVGTGLTGRLIDLPPMPFVTITGTFVGAMLGGGLLGVLLHRNARTADTPDSETNSPRLVSVEA